MNARALTLALRLLTTACAGVALGTMTGCPFFFGCGDDDGWQDPETLATMTESDLFAFVQLDDYEDQTAWDYLAVGAEGTVVVLGSSFDDSSSTAFANVYQAGTQTLRGALQVGNEWWIIGDAGIAAYSINRGQTWSNILLQTAANLRAIVEFNSSLVIVGDDVVFARAPDGTWSEVIAPSGTWGQLRDAWVESGDLYVVGLGGVVWRTSDLSGEWVAEDPGTSADLFGVGSRVFQGETAVIVVGAGGTAIIRDSTGTWIPVDLGGVTNDILAWSEDAALLDDGRVLEVVQDGEVDIIGEYPGARSLVFNKYSSLTLAGDGGTFTTQHYYECVGGRPFGASTSAPLTAARASGRAWLDADIASVELTNLDPETRAALAAAWTRDGLFEHASVASFARFAGELLALGAPASLVAAAHAAADDEIRHAQQCLALAARFVGDPPCPAGLPLPDQLWARSGDPVATALALFEEGCINESVAACAAADAAEACADPATRAVLETIADDEARHATLAWSALRWLLDHHGQTVATPLRARVAQLGRRPARETTDELDLARWGRLSPSRLREVEDRVVAELVRPLASRMLLDVNAREPEPAIDLGSQCG